MYQGHPNFEWAPGEVINNEVDEKIPQENLIMDVYGNAYNNENEG